jgi:hypothetical protein
MHRGTSARLTGIGATRLAIAGELAATIFKLQAGSHHRNMAEISRTKGFPLRRQLLGHETNNAPLLADELGLGSPSLA